MSNQSSFTIGKITKMVCPPDKQQVIYWDSSNSGYFGVRVTKSQAKSFILQARLNDQTIRKTIGGVNQITIKDALEIAQTKLLEIKKGNDPRVSHEVAKQKAVADRESGRSGIDIWHEYILARKHKWGDRHLSEHLDMVRDGGELIKRGLRKGQSNIKREGILRNLLSLPVKELTREKVESWLKSEVDFRPARVRIALSALKAFFTWAGDQTEYKSQIPVNPCERLAKELPPKNAKNDCLQREQLRLWFEGVNRINNQIIRSYLQILLLTGARRNELATLKWRDLDLTWNTATIRDKVEGVRQISITPYIAKLLKDLPRVNENVFHSTTAKLGFITEPRKAHQIVIQSAGLPDLSIHGLRRSFGTLAEWVECPAGISAQIMGHKPSAIAEKHYRRRSVDLLRKWHTKIEKFILDEAGIIQPTWDELKEQKAIRLINLN